MLHQAESDISEARKRLLHRHGGGARYSKRGRRQPSGGPAVRGHVSGSQNLHRPSVSPDELDRNAQKAKHRTHVL